METEIHQHLDGTVTRHFQHPAARSVIKCGLSWSPTEVSPELASKLPILQVTRVLSLAGCLCVCVSLSDCVSLLFACLRDTWHSVSDSISCPSVCVSVYVSVSVCLRLSQFSSWDDPMRLTGC